MSSDGQSAKIPQNYRGRPSFTSVSFLAVEDEISTAANANNSVLAKIHQGVEYFELNRLSRLKFLPAKKNHQGLGDSEDEAGAKIFSVPDYETGQQVISTYPARTDAKTATARER